MVARPLDSMAAAISGCSPISWRNLVVVTSLQ
jgi:hypothetical protein